MAWGGIKCDKYYRVPGGIGISEYFLKDHGYIVPGKRAENPKGITIVPQAVHFASECNAVIENGIIRSSDDYAIKNIEELTPDGLIPHFIVTRHSNWNILDLVDCWQRTNGTASSNTISIGITMDDDLTSWQYKLIATEHAAMLVAYLLKKYKLTDKDISVSKACPEFFKLQWNDFKQKVRTQLKKL